MGIKNTNFFHSLLKHRGRKRYLSSMYIGDDIIYDPERISDHVVFYYQHLFSNPRNSSLDLSIVREHIPSLVTSDENALILRVPSYNEMREMIFDMDPLSAPRS